MPIAKLTSNTEASPIWWKDSRFVGSLLAMTGWLVWAYARLRPPIRIMKAFHPLTGYDRWAYSHLAYSDIIAIYRTHHLSLHLLPYIHSRIEYPVVMGVMMWLSSLAPGFWGYFTVSALVIWGVALISLVLLRRVSPKTYHWMAWSPLLLIYGLLNWDLVGIFFLISGWFLYREKRWHGAAAMLSLGVFFKLFPIFLLPFIAVELYREGRIGILARMLGTFLAVGLTVNLPFALTNFRNWSFFFRFNANRAVGADLWSNQWIRVSSVPTVDGLSLAIVASALAWLLWQVYQGAPAMPAAAKLFALFLMINKVYSPQYMLWMLALAVMAEWPVASYALLAAGGLADYLNSMVILHFLRTRSPALAWYGQRIFPLGLAVRYGSLLIATLIAPKTALPAAAVQPLSQKASSD